MIYASMKRNVALVLDNCPTHVAVSHLTNTNIVMLPSGTTSRTQPMDMGHSQF